MSDLSKRVEALAKQWDRLSHNKAIAISAQIAHGEDARALRSLLAESLEEGKPPHPQIVRYETTLDGVHVTVRRDALEWLENQITLSPPASAGTEGLRELVRQWQDHPPGATIRCTEAAVLLEKALAARPVEGEKK